MAEKAREKEFRPLVTYALAALCVIVYLWDRSANGTLLGLIFGPNTVFADLAVRPRETVEALRGTGDRFSLVTLFTSLFLHGSIVHVGGNLLFLLVFGPEIEEAFGSPRFAIYYLGWGFAAGAAQIGVDARSLVPFLGASGAIGGIMGAYLVLFPANKLEVFVPIIWAEWEISAWILLLGWFAFQVLAKQEGVAAWAHVGGFLAGMITVLLAGGRGTILRGREERFQPA